MRHLAFLRVYVTFDRVPERLHQLARNATKLTRADIEAEAAQRLNRRLRPDAFSSAPRSVEPPIIRVISATPPGRATTRHYFHVDYLERAAFESQHLRREYYDDALYNRLVPPKTLTTLEHISELQADAELISRPVPNMHMELWNVPLAWLAAFGGEYMPWDHNFITETSVHGTPIVRRVRDIYGAYNRLAWLQRYLGNYGPDDCRHPHYTAITNLLSWITSHHLRQPCDGLIELDYGALSRYAWPDAAGKALEEGHAVIERVAELEDRAELEFEEDADEDASFYGLPPAMLNQAAQIMQARYVTATNIWDRIRRYEHAN